MSEHTGPFDGEQYVKFGTIEHPQQPEGGRGLAEYERQLLFSRNELRDKRCLDLGAGPQTKFATELRDAGITDNVISLSVDFATQEHANNAITAGGEELVAAKGQMLPFADNSFDVIVAFHIDEHLTPGATLVTVKETARTLAPGGLAKLGPTVDYPHSWREFEAITKDKDLMAYFESIGVSVSQEPIPETIIAKTRIKNQYDDVYYMPSYNIVLKKIGSTEA